MDPETSLFLTNRNLLWEPPSSLSPCTGRNVLQFLEEFNSYPIKGLSLLLVAFSFKLFAVIRSQSQLRVRNRNRPQILHIWTWEIESPHLRPTEVCWGVMGAHGSSLDEVLAEDMHHWYNKFMKESPSGLITLFELKTMLQMQGMTDEANGYVDQVFVTFDMDGVRETFFIISLGLDALLRYKTQKSFVLF